MAHFIGHHGIRNSSSGATRRNSTHSSSSRPGEHDTRDTVTDQRPDFYLNDNQDDYDDYSTGSRPSLLGEDQLPPNALKVLVNDNSDSHEPPQQKKPSDSDSSLIVPTSRPGLTARTSSAARLQAAGRKLAAARILSGGRDDWEDARTPGIDPAKVDLPDLKAPVVIQAVDCCRETVNFSVLDAQTLPDYLARPRPEWSKTRWIHVNGLSWDVVKPLGLHFELPPLAIEDMLHQSSVRSKADYYQRHLFLNLIWHRLLEVDHEEVEDSSPVSFDLLDRPAKVTMKAHGHRMGFHNSGRDEEYVVEAVEGGGRSSPSYGSGATTPAQPGSYPDYLRKLHSAFRKIKPHLHDGKRTLSPNAVGVGRGRKRTVRSGKKRRKSYSERQAARWTVAELTKDVKVHIHVEQIAVFILRGGTMITFSQDSGYHQQVSSIFDRISSSDDLIRESEDISMMLQAVLDASGDDLLAVADEFRDQLTTLESHVLSNPSMSDVRHLHILSSQLLMLKSSITPFQYLLHALRSQDDMKAAAAAKPDGGSRGSGVAKRMGFVSHEAKVYLGDVIDHVDSVLSSLDLFGDLAENLVAFTFNDLSYSSNAYMQALSVLSVIFLPLTFLSGYFGMNFEGPFPGIPQGVWYFWQIAIPVAVGTVVIFGWTYIMKLMLQAKRSAIRLYHRSVVERRSKAE